MSIIIYVSFVGFTINWFQFDISVSDENSLLDTQVLVTPNPASNSIEIMLPENKSIDQIKVLDIFGRTIAQSKNKLVDVSYFPSGVYLLNVESEGTNYQAKFIKE